MWQLLLASFLKFCHSLINVLNSNMQSQTHLIARHFSGHHILSDMFDLNNKQKMYGPIPIDMESNAKMQCTPPHMSRAKSVLKIKLLWYNRTNGSFKQYKLSQVLIKECLETKASHILTALWVFIYISLSSLLNVQNA